MTVSLVPVGSHGNKIHLTKELHDQWPHSQASLSLTYMNLQYWACDFTLTYTLKLCGA